MDDIQGLIQNLAGSVWGILTDSAFLLLIGIFLAGLLHLFLREGSLRTILKGGRRTVVFKAALLGIPLPLCSCSVLPVADQLRRSGLSRGGTAAFLIATPETGVDSILLTYSLTDPLLTIARPISAFITAMAAGLVVESSEEEAVAEDPKIEGCSHCATETVTEIAVENKPAFLKRAGEAMRYAYVTLLGDMSPYLVIGYIMAGVVAMVLGSEMVDIPDVLRTGWGGYVGAIFIGLPLYICATSSTPLAAVLLAAGFSPGAIMVFLLVGPATNVASLTVVRKILGGSSFLRYLAVIIVFSIICGVAVDGLYTLVDYSPGYKMGQHEHGAGLIATVSAIIFSVWITFLALRKLFKRLS